MGNFSKVTAQPKEAQVKSDSISSISSMTSSAAVLDFYDII